MIGHPTLVVCKSIQNGILRLGQSCSKDNLGRYLCKSIISNNNWKSIGFDDSGFKPFDTQSSPTYFLEVKSPDRKSVPEYFSG